MDYLMKRVDYSLLSSQTFLNDEGLFESMRNALSDGVNKVMSTTFGHSDKDCFSYDEESR